MSTPQTWLTQEAADRLRAELENLENVGRKEVTAKIEAARAEGDLKENGGYHAARDEQGKIEARIPKKTQVPINANTRAILYGGIASASRIVVAASASLFFTFAPIESPLRKINATNPEQSSKAE